MMSFCSALTNRSEETGHHLSWDFAEDADNGKQPPEVTPVQYGVSCWKGEFSVKPGLPGIALCVRTVPLWMGWGH